MPIVDLPSLHAFSRRLDDVLADLARDPDLSASFVAAGLEGLRGIGALHAPFPRKLGGIDLGGASESQAGLSETLRRIGRCSLPLGRVFEGHVNAIRLIMLYGTEEQVRQASRDSLAGHLFGIWAAERPDQRVHLRSGRLTGCKAFASAAHHVTRALITAEFDAEEQLVLVPLDENSPRAGIPFDLHGMQAAGTAPYDFDGIQVARTALIGGPGDYMREPEISIGAWRTLSVQVGGAEALLDLFRYDLLKRHRSSDPHQLVRAANVMIAVEGARLWVKRAALLGATDDAAHYVGLARHAVETACMDVISLVQAGVGLTGFVRPHPIESLCRDLSMYLRQPAMDEVMVQAASHFLTHDLP